MGQDLNFYLVNLALLGQDKNIGTIFKRHIYENQRMKFIRITWENIYQQILNSGLPGKDKDKMIVDIQEAYHIENVKIQFFDRLRNMIRKRVAKSSPDTRLSGLFYNRNKIRRLLSN